MDSLISSSLFPTHHFCCRHSKIKTFKHHLFIPRCSSGRLTRPPSKSKDQPVSRRSTPRRKQRHHTTHIQPHRHGKMSRSNITLPLFIYSTIFSSPQSTGNDNTPIEHSQESMTNFSFAASADHNTCIESLDVRSHVLTLEHWRDWSPLALEFFEWKCNTLFYFVIPWTNGATRWPINAQTWPQIVLWITSNALVDGREARFEVVKIYRARSLGERWVEEFLEKGDHFSGS